MITGQTLILWGFKPGKWFKDAIAVANQMRSAGADDDMIFKIMQERQPIETLLRTNGIPYGVFLDAGTDAEQANAASVHAHMDALMRVPTIVAGTVMPDACPAGAALGTIPVGGAVACEDAIHPGFHSADICCSVAITIFRRKDDPRRILDAMHSVTHFGPGGRDLPAPIEADLMRKFETNRFLSGLENFARYHLMTQGDGNHFAYVGHIKSTGQPALVTHHGSRGLGAQLYKRGMSAAKRHTAIVAPKVPSHNSWIKASSHEGEGYWEALQVIREWTKENHFTLHDLVSRKIGNAVEHRFWNEHNFVFQKSDGLFYHGKGATPSWSGFSADDSGLTLIPLNMAEPILIASHKDTKGSLGFAPHGAGRNYSRTQHMRDWGHLVEGELADLKARGLDIRSFCGEQDNSELPSAYKNAATLRAQIEKYELAHVVDQVDPYGCIMAGESWGNEPWRRR